MKIRDLSSWESFYWVAKETNFARAAKKLNIGPSLLSKRINRLEDDLGIRLFHRSTRKVTLTQDGLTLLPRVKSFLEDAQGLEDQFENKKEVEGTIRFTCITAFTHRVMTPLIAKFCKLYPNVEFEIDASDRVVDIIDSQMDFVIRVQEPTGADFIFKKLLQNNLVACATAQYLKDTKKIRCPEDLKHHRILTLKAYEDCRFANSTLTVGALAGSQKIRAESGLLLTDLACKGMGVTIRSKWDVHLLLKTGKLVQVLEDYPLEPFGDIYAIIPNRRLLAHRVRIFIDFLMKEAKTWKF